jgi:tricorn protease
VENYGVDPDTEVLITPDDAAAGRDTQLEHAVQVALDAIDKQPSPVPPDIAAGPVKARPPLPPRSGSPGPGSPGPGFPRPYSPEGPGR